MTAPVKEFVMRHDFKDVPKFKEGVYQYSPREEHFNIPWKMSVVRRDGFLGVYLYCDQLKTNKSIRVEFSIQLITVTGKKNQLHTSLTYNTKNYAWGWGKFLDWKKMEKDYMIDEHITVETHVKIIEITGIKRKKLKNFDATMEEYSDLVIIVEDEKFHISKFFLADQSTYFKSLLTRKQEESEKPDTTLDDCKSEDFQCFLELIYGEFLASQSTYFESLLSKKQRGSKKSEITLDGCKSEDFQYFLELIYGESPIDEETIDKIVHLADKYKAPTAIRKCEEFLMNNSGKTLKEKLQMAKNYKLENLKTACLSKINTVEDIRSVLSYTTSEMDPSVVGALLQKSLSLLP
ncbi:hypothetical protein GCK72_007423 [Caenorhabditis remanei]|uniref:BTB domain-containing protein n=1 Tax=Caenorhabditis remanei TaxID=31234 RepID=A0A6A5HLH4_CAERE|nr:hypothetical protein GCK72_007423 [Caenorhabditis remanei]KAF1767464.1 hypothetical protein GCK72_007423 [Caenorhabditis remanei]